MNIDLISMMNAAEINCRDILYGKKLLSRIHVQTSPCSLSKFLYFSDVIFYDDNEKYHVV